MNDLEWIARKVNKPDRRMKYSRSNTDHMAVLVSPIKYKDSLPFLNEFFSGEEVVAERARLQNKPGWDDHKWPSIFQSSDGNWFGVREGWLLRDHISGGWKGREVSLLREDGQFICHGLALMNWENSQEFRSEEQNMTKKEWCGPEDGLPPVGTECKVFHNDEWVKCEIIGHFKQPAGMCVAFVYGYDERFGIRDIDYYMPDAFRPLRTEEDRAVEDMYRDATGDELCGDEMDDQDIVSLCQVLFKAGYRKQEPSE